VVIEAELEAALRTLRGAPDAVSLLITNVSGKLSRIRPKHIPSFYVRRFRIIPRWRTFSVAAARFANHSIPGPGVVRRRTGSAGRRVSPSACSF